MGGYQQEKTEAEKKIQITKEKFEELKIADVYSDFNCIGTYITHSKGGEKWVDLKVGEGYDTKEKIESVNQECETDITLEELLTSPQSVRQKVSLKQRDYNRALQNVG